MINRKISTLTGIIIILATAVLLFGGVFGWQYYLVKNETADWKTYTNSEYGFEIKYPPGTEIILNNPIDDFTSASLLYIYYTNDVLEESLAVNTIRQPYSVDGKIYNNIDEFMSAGGQNENRTIKSKKTIVLGSRTGLKISGNNKEGSIGQDGFNEIWAMLPNSDIIIIYYVDKFSDIASTFKFTK